MRVLLLFFCSGATALVYEVVWSKYLALMFGSTVQAQTVVLAVFMGGLALGNHWVGAWSDRLRNPLAAYGYLEIAIGLYAFFFNPIYQVADSVFINVGARVLEQGTLLLAFKGVLSLMLLLGPTILMGGTLPLLAAWLQRQSSDPGRLSARFYSVNSLGAVFGSAMAGFVLVKSLGLVSTLQLTAIANVIIGFLAILFGRQIRFEPVSGTRIESSSGESQNPPAVLRRAVLCVALTGAVSMGLEVLAARSLALIFGSSLQAFAIVLMAFILGIGLGGAAMASPRLTRWREHRILFTLLLGAAAVVGVLVWGIEQWVEVYRHIRTGLARTGMGYVFHQLAVAAMAMVVLGIPAALLGAVLPLCIRAEGSTGAALGKRVGRLLTWNTVGAVTGVLITGFVLMPRIGLRGAFVLLAILLCVASLALAADLRKKVPALVSGSLACALLGMAFASGEGWRHVLSSGVFRARETVVNPHTLAARKQHIKILFYEDAADATVTVEEGDGVGAPADRGLRINGKPEASTRGDLSTQFLVAHLPLVARPQSTEVFMLGFGSGISAGAILGHPVEHLAIAENCEPAIRAGHLFNQWNRGVLTHPAVRIWNEDARTVLKLDPRKYDVIISQPSNPWMAGVGSVFSREYYQLAASRLKEGGIMCQWFHVYEMSDDIVALVLRTFSSVYPYVEIWDPAAGDVILLGSMRPWENSMETFKTAFSRPEPRKDFERIGIGSAEAFWARQLASLKTGFAVVGRGPVQSDAFPILEYAAPRAFYIGESSILPVLFDERTWQMDLAPEEKRRTLSTLDRQQLIRAFAEFRSVNPQLGQYLGILAQSENQQNPPALNSGDGPVPCIFAPTNLVDILTHPSPTAGPSARLASMAEASLRSGTGDWSAAVSQIETLLNSQAPDGKLDDWSPVRAAAIASKICIQHGDFERAATLLESALQRAPNSPELLYLARIVERNLSTNAATQVRSRRPR